MVEKFEIKAQKVKKNYKVKEEIYTSGFYKWILDIRPYKGQLVKDAKDKVKEILIKSG